MPKVVHLSSLHARSDTRIFVKMCASLAASGFEVSYVVADGLGDAINRGVNIIDAGLREKPRLRRMRVTVQRVFETGLKLDADLYHLHDPELIPVGRKLKRLGKKVIFDAHEDLPRQIANKPYLDPVSRKLLSALMERYLHWICPVFDALISATPTIQDRLAAMGIPVVTIHNFPLQTEFGAAIEWADRPAEVSYVGGMAEIRGIKQIVKAMALTRGVRLNLAGPFGESATEAEVKSYDAWASVNELGVLDRYEVGQLLARSIAGLVTLHPVSNYLDALPVKMFEYMAAGIPVIASDFPLWREIVEGNNCGICVDPFDVSAIADAIQYLCDHRDEAELMGQNGKRAVSEQYNWSREERKLIDLYNRLLN